MSFISGFEKTAVTEEWVIRRMASGLARRSGLEVGHEIIEKAVNRHKARHGVLRGSVKGMGALEPVRSLNRETESTLRRHIHDQRSRARKRLYGMAKD